MIEHRKLKKYMIPLVGRYARYVYGKCTLLMVPSLEVVHELDLAGIRTRKALVHLGVDSDFFVPPQHGKIKAKKKLHLNPNRIIIGYTGRISKEKNLPTLAKAVAGLQKKYPEIFLYIVGDGKRSEIEKHINKGYKITGFVSNVIPHLQAMDIFVLPSLTETSSLSTMEAMSCGLAVVATPVGHVKEYIKNGRNGMTFPKENDFVLRKKLEMLVMNHDLRESLGSRARNTITKKYNWERTIIEIEKILERY
jgi:glycosyltransferase involved in cell wall biosynthesis